MCSKDAQRISDETPLLGYVERRLQGDLRWHVGDGDAGPSDHLLQLKAKGSP